MMMTRMVICYCMVKWGLMPRLQHEYFYQMQSRRSMGYEDRLGATKRPLEDRDLLPGLEMQVVVNGEKHHEVQEERGGWQEMPDVMVVVKVEQLTLEERCNIRIACHEVKTWLFGGVKFEGDLWKEALTNLCVEPPWLCWGKEPARWLVNKEPYRPSPAENIKRQ